MSEREGAGRRRGLLRRRPGPTSSDPVPEQRSGPVAPGISLSQRTRAPSGDPDQEDTVRIATGDFLRRRRAGRWRVVRRVVAAILVLAVLAGAGWLVFFSDYVTAERVEVTGTSTIPDVRWRGSTSGACAPGWRRSPRSARWRCPAAGRTPYASPSWSGSRSA
jgi:hypothetical protein